MRRPGLKCVQALPLLCRAMPHCKELVEPLVDGLQMLQEQRTKATQAEDLSDVSATHVDRTKPGEQR